MRIGARDHLRPDLFAKLSVGLSQIHSIVLLSRRKIIKELVAQMKDSIRHHYQLLQDSIGSTVSIDEADVFNAVHQRFERFLSVVYYYANGVNFISARDINYVRFPYQSDDFTQEIATRFVDALYYVDEEKNFFSIFQDLKESQYCVGGKAMTEDNAGEMIDHLTDYLEGIEAIANKGFKTKNGKQQVNSLLAMITSLLNSLQLKEFDRERAHRAETLDEQIDDGKFMKGIINVVIADHKVLSERIILFLRKTLEWFFTSLVDVVLLLERVEATPPSDSNRLTVLDRDISSLVLRSRLQFGYRAWVDETIIHMAAVTRHSQTVDPLKVFSAVNTVLQQVDNFSYFGDTNTKALPNAAAIQIAKDMQKSSSQPPPQEFFDKTSDDQLITVLFGDMITVAQRFNAAYMKANNLENIDGNFAQLMFNSLKSRSWMHITIELMRIIVFFDSKEYSSDYYKDNLTRKLHSFVYNQVAKPMLLSVERAPLSGGRITSKSEESWADSMYVLNVTNSAEQDKVLAEMYRWSESTAQQQSSPPEQKILNILKRKTPKAKNFRHTPTTSGKRSASRKAAAPKTQAAAASAEPSPPASAPQHSTTTTTGQAASGGGAASNGPHTQTESGGADAAAAQTLTSSSKVEPDNENDDDDDLEVLEEEEAS